MPKDFAGVVLVHPSNIKKLRWIKWGKAFRVITSCTRLTLRSSPSTILLRKAAEPPLKRVPPLLVGMIKGLLLIGNSQLTDILKQLLKQF